jgi:hypothetical protein
LVSRIVALAENLLLGKMLSSRVFNDAAETNTCMVNIPEKEKTEKEKIAFDCTYLLFYFKFFGSP